MSPVLTPRAPAPAPDIRWASKLTPQLPFLKSINTDRGCLIFFHQNSIKFWGILSYHFRFPNCPKVKKNFQKLNLNVLHRFWILVTILYRWSVSLYCEDYLPRGWLACLETLIVYFSYWGRMEDPSLGVIGPWMSADLIRSLREIFCLSHGKAPEMWKL